MIIGFIYKITNNINGKFYIGSTADTVKRFNEHRWKLNNKRHENKYLQRSWDKYGEENFMFEIVDEVVGMDVLDVENMWLKTTRCYDRSIGFNIHMDAVAKNKGLKMSEEQKAKIGASNKGKVRSAELRKQIGEKSRGRQVSDETRKKLSIASTGRRHSEESRRKIGLAHKGKKVSDEFREKLRKANLGKKLSEEQKRKISERVKGDKHPSRKLSSEDVKVIKRLLVEGYTSAFIGRTYNVTPETISNINLGKTWKDVSKLEENLIPEYLHAKGHKLLDFDRYLEEGSKRPCPSNSNARKLTSQSSEKSQLATRGQKVTKELARTVKEMLVDGYHYTDISIRLGLNHSVVLNIKSGRTFKNVEVEGFKEEISRISEKTAATVKRMLTSGYKCKEVAKGLGLPVHVIHDIYQGRSFREVYVEGFIPSENKRNKLSEGDVSKIIQMVSQGSTQKEVAKLFNVDSSTISKAIKSYKTKNL